MRADQSLTCVLSSAIVLITQPIKPANSMGGPEGHDLSGESHDAMMRVDGAFNPVPVTVAVVQPGNFEAGVVYPRGAGLLTNDSVYLGDRVEAGQVIAELIADERSIKPAEARAEADAMNTSLPMSQAKMAEPVPEVARRQAALDYWKLQRDRFAQLTAEGATSQTETGLAKIIRGGGWGDRPQESSRK